MIYIHIAPLITEEEFLKTLKKIETIRTATIDVMIISNLVSLCYFCVLKKGELIDINVGDVTGKRGAVLDKIKVGTKELCLTDEAKIVIVNHYNYLGRKGYKRYKGSPFFPTKKNQRYKAKTLRNHLNYVFDKFNFSIQLEKIKQSGINRFYNDCLKNGGTEERCLEKTATFARLDSSKFLSGLLKKLKKSKHEHEANKKTPFMKYVNLITLLSFTKNYNDKKRRLNLVLKKINEDPGLIASEKESLKIKIENLFKGN